MYKVKYFLLILLLLISIPTIVLAQEEDNGAADQIREAVKEKVKEKIEGVTNRKVGIVGIIKQIQENFIDVSTGSENFVVLTDGDTEYSRVRGNSSLERDEIELDEHAIVMGFLSNDEEKTIKASMIQLIKEPEVPEREVFFGKLLDVDRNGLTLSTSGKKEVDVSFNRYTDLYTKSEAGSIKDIKYSQLEVGDLIIIGGAPDKNKSEELKGLIVLRISVVDGGLTSDSSTAKEAGASAEAE